MDGFDLFGAEPKSGKAQSKASARRLLERRIEEAQGQFPKVIHMLGQARDAAEPYERAFWSAHRDLEAAWTDGAKLTKVELMALYDARLNAGHAWYPYRQVEQAIRDWFAALQKEIKWCEAALG